MIFPFSKKALQPGGLLPKALIFFSACAISLMMAEILLRLTLGPPELPTPTGLLKADRACGYKMTPNYDSPLRNREFRIRIRTNSEGFRDDEWNNPVGDRAKSLRVLALGDSFGFGYGVEHEQNFLSLVEKTTSALGSNLEILNACVTGWGPPQEATLAEELLQRDRVDVALLLLYVGNDFTDALYPRGNNTIYDGVMISREQFQSTSKPVLALKVFARKHFKVYEAFRDVSHKLVRGKQERFKRDFPQFEVCRIKPDIAISTAGQTKGVFEALKRFKDACNNHRVKPGLVIIPSRFQCSAAYRESIISAYGLDRDAYSPQYPNRVLNEMAKKLSIPVLDYLPLIMREGNPDRFYFKKDNHWNASGHRFATLPLADFLRTIHAE